MSSFICIFFFFKQKTAYEMRISDWSSDVCSSDLVDGIVTVAVSGDAQAASVRLVGDDRELLGRVLLRSGRPARGDDPTRRAALDELRSVLDLVDRKSVV